MPRSSFYYEPNPAESIENLALMRDIDRLYMRYPFYGAPRLTVTLRAQGQVVNEKRVARLMRVMGIQAIVPGPHTSRPHPAHRVFPYLLRGLPVTASNMVWCTDITYVPMARGFMYLVVIMDWFSRYVLAWELSNTLETSFCVRALRRALAQHGVPGIFNSDQGSQFTCEEFLCCLEAAAIRISMDGRGRALDNVFVERLWRSLKYENIYPKDYRDGQALHEGLHRYFPFYNAHRPHQALAYQTPALVYHAGLPIPNSNTAVSPMGEEKGGNKTIAISSQHCILVQP